MLLAGVAADAIFCGAMRIVCAFLFYQRKLNAIGEHSTHNDVS